jgi:hypothetical protein
MTFRVFGRHKEVACARGPVEVVAVTEEAEAEEEDEEEAEEEEEDEEEAEEEAEEEDEEEEEETLEARFTCISENTERVLFGMMKRAHKFWKQRQFASAQLIVTNKMPNVKCIGNRNNLTEIETI